MLTDSPPEIARTKLKKLSPFPNRSGTGEIFDFQRRLRLGTRLALALCFMLCAASVRAENKTPDIFQQSRKLGRGVNILGYDPIWRSREQAHFKEKHFRALAQAGFNAVRVNLHAFHQMSATNDWALPESWWAVADWAVQNAEANGLRVILDLHEYGPMGTDPSGNKPKFLAFWKQVSAHYQNAPESVYFEILNEPSKEMTPSLWNEYLRDALAIIRKTNPSRSVIIGPGYWNSIAHLRELDLPAQDRNLIVTIHYYSPMDFTHQGAAWANRKDKLGVDWLGTEKDLAAINKDFDTAQAWSREHHRPIFLGEFGAYDKGPMDSRVRYTSSVARAAEARGWSWAYWQFDSDFIVWDMKKDAWVTPIRDALIPAR